MILFWRRLIVDVNHISTAVYQVSNRSCVCGRLTHFYAVDSEPRSSFSMS